MKIKLSKDGNKYVALLGEDLQNGVAGFGDSYHEAISDLLGTDIFIKMLFWFKQFYNTEIVINFNEIKDEMQRMLLTDEFIELQKNASSIMTVLIETEDK